MLATLQVIILNLVSLKNFESQSRHKNLNWFNSALGLIAKCQIGGACRNFLISSHIFLAPRNKRGIKWKHFVCPNDFFYSPNKVTAKTIFLGHFRPWKSVIPILMQKLYFWKNNPKSSKQMCPPPHKNCSQTCLFIRNLMSMSRSSTK